jgi:hypothetical protein
MSMGPPAPEKTSHPGTATRRHNVAGVVQPKAVEHQSLTRRRRSWSRSAPGSCGRPLGRVPAGRGRGATRPVRRDPAPDRSAQAEPAAAPGMSIDSNTRWQPDRRGATRDRPRAAESCRTAGHKPQDAVLRDRGLVRAPKALPSTPERRIVGLHEPASGESRIR